MSFPKFYVGQKVVAVKDSPMGTFSKGEVFEVKGVRKNCCNWLIDIGKYNHGTQMCSKCREILGTYGETLWLNEKLFEAIIENFQAITFEKILEKELASVN